MAIRFPQAVLFNLGVDPKMTYEGKRPTTRMGTAAMVRQALTDAAGYVRKFREFNDKKEKRRNEEKNADDKQKKPEKDDDEPSPPKIELKSEALARVLSKQVPAVFCAQQADDILTALRIIREFKLNGQIALAAEGYLCSDEIQQAGVPVIVHPTMQRVGSLETYNSFLGNAATLAGKGIPIAIGSGVEDYVPKTRVVRYEAAMGMVYGLGFDRALRAVTLDAAKILGIDDRFGSVEVGKAADLVLYDGDPFEHVTHTTHVLVDGKLVYDRSQRPSISVAERAWIQTPELPCCLGW
jgi:imidazolonepropionase-like amidohydrolase